MANEAKRENRKKGQLVVLEGADGTGKTTQAKLLFNFLKKRKIPAVLISFPRYESGWGKMVKRYLEGEFGCLGQVDPYLASMLYAGDRLLAKDQMNQWLREGRYVVCDRYVASNMAHMAAKLTTHNSKLKFIKWLEELEYSQNKIPREDLVILLTIPSNVAQKFMKRRRLDIHEKNVQYQEKVARAFSEYSKRNKNWIEVSNVKNGKLRPILEVHQEIVSQLEKRKIT